MADNQEQTELLKQILHELRMINQSSSKSMVQLTNLAAHLQRR